LNNDPEVQKVVNTFRLGTPRVPVAGQSGEILGRHTGSSLEFQEFREYTPGDDIRHLDWAAYGRSDALMIRMYREEISPRMEVLLDASKSMTTGNEQKQDGQKQKVALQLAASFVMLAQQSGGNPMVTVLKDAFSFQKIHGNELEELDRISFEGTTSFDADLVNRQLELRSRSVRIVISDFLFPHDPRLLIQSLARNAGSLWIVQILSDWEAFPSPVGGRKLIDSESGEEIDVILDDKTIHGYKRRLARLQDEMARGCQQVHAIYLRVIAERGLFEICHREFCAAELLQPK